MDRARINDSLDALPYLICRSHTSLFALPLALVAETMRPQPSDPLGAMPPFLLGVSVIRGAPVPVVDAARLLGSAQRAPPRRIVTLKVGERRVALAVESVIGVRALSAAALEEVPPLLRGAAEATVAALATLDAQLLLVLQSARIVPDSVWEDIESELTQP